MHRFTQTPSLNLVLKVISVMANKARKTECRIKLVSSISTVECGGAHVVSVASLVFIPSAAP